QEGFTYAGQGPAHPVVFTEQGNSSNPQKFIQLTRQGYVIVLAIHRFTPHTTKVGSAWTTTFTKVPGGHVMALNGFHDGTTADPKLIIHDPVYANTLDVSVPVLKAGTVTATDGRSIEVKPPTGGDVMMIAYDTTNYDPKSPSSDQVTFIDEWYALK